MYSNRNSVELSALDSTNPYRPTTTTEPEDLEDDTEEGPLTKTPRLIVIFGGVCLLMAVMQEAFYILVLSVSTSEPALEEHAIPEMSTASAMAGLTATYAAFIARLLYLLVSTRRPEVVCTRRWCWVLSALVIITHILLCVWFGLHQDYAPLGVYVISICLYTAFAAAIATLKLSDHTISKRKSDVINSPESQPSLNKEEEPV